MRFFAAFNAADLTQVLSRRLRASGPDNANPDPRWTDLTQTPREPSHGSYAGIRAHRGTSDGGVQIA
jgi:hypothetical protein